MRREDDTRFDRPTRKPADDRRILGTEGERRAAVFLKRRGYRILERNVRYDRVEIDLIARRGSLVVFVEVKTRRTSRFGTPETAVDGNKQARIVRAARAWLCEHPHRSTRIRFDVVSCTVTRGAGGEDWRIDHWPAAFDASG